MLAFGGTFKQSGLSLTSFDLHLNMEVRIYWGGD